MKAVSVTTKQQAPLDEKTTEVDDVTRTYLRRRIRTGRPFF